MRFKILGLCVLAGLAGCLIGPDYRKPETVLPEGWNAARDPAASALKPVTEDTLQTWWQTFHDPGLNRLMDQARSGNLDLQQAFIRIEQARAQRRIERADLLPQVAAVGAGIRQENLIPGGLPVPAASNLFLTGFDAIWELDLFGRQRRRLEAATAQTEAVTEDYRQSWVLLAAELARDYTQYRSLQEQLRITQANLAAQRHTLELTERLYRAGLGTRYAVDRAQAQVDATAAGIPLIEGQLTAVQSQLETLVGARPGALQPQLAAPGQVPESAARELLTTPADTLRYRPDVRSAERRLAAATAMQGEAFAQLFPRLSIAALVGLQNSAVEELFNADASFWVGGGVITQPIFNFGKIRAGIDLADARQQEAYWHYEKAVLAALHETETALIQFLKEEQRRQTLARSLAKLKQSLQQAELLYREGLATFLEVLDAQRAIYAQELELARSQAQTTTNLIALYKALGGSGQLPVKPAADPLRPWG